MTDCHSNLGPTLICRLADSRVRLVSCFVNYLFRVEQRVTAATTATHKAEAARALTLAANVTLRSSAGPDQVALVAPPATGPQTAAEMADALFSAPSAAVAVEETSASASSGKGRRVWLGGVSSGANGSANGASAPAGKHESAANQHQNTEAAHVNVAIPSAGHTGLTPRRDSGDGEAAQRVIGEIRARVGKIDRMMLTRDGGAMRFGPYPQPPHPYNDPSPCLTPIPRIVLSLPLTLALALALALALTRCDALQGPAHRHLRAFRLPDHLHRRAPTAASRIEHRPQPPCPPLPHLSPIHPSRAHCAS